MSARDVLSDGAGIADVRSALLGAGPRRTLRNTIQGLLERGATLRTCRLRRAKFKPGRKLTVHFDVRVRSKGSDTVRSVVTVWSREVGDALRDPAIASLESEAVSAGLASPFRELMAELPAPRVSIKVSPLDPKLPQLLRLSNPAHVAAMLTDPARRMPRGGYRVSTVRYRPGERHVLRYDPVPLTSGQAVFAKLSRRDADVARAFQLATRVADWLDASGGETRAVRPLAIVPADGVILYPEVSGRPLSDSIRAGDRALAGHLRRAADALRALHAAPASLVESVPAREFARDVEAVRRASEHITALAPRTGELIREALERAGSAYARMPSEPAAFTHGDFKADHLWATRDRLTLLDFGSCASGDPACDVGKFLADLRWWATLSRRPASGTRAAFRRAYAVGGNHARLRRAGVYEALFLVMFAAHRVPLYERDWAERTARQVRRALGILEKLA